MPSILLVAAAFAPSKQIGGRRAERMAVYLAQHGWQVTVLAMHASYMPPEDPSLRFAAAGVEVLRTHALTPRRFLRAGVAAIHGPTRPVPNQPAGPTVALQQRSWARRQVAWLLDRFDFPDEVAGWRPFAKAAVRGRRFDVVLGSLPPISSGPLAAELARLTHARLVLDYRDPWTEIRALWDTPRDLDRHRRLEDACLAQAALVIAVTPTLCQWLQERSGRPVALVTNGFDAPVFQQFAPPVPPARLVYAGSLAYGRDLQPLLRAMALLRRDAQPLPLQLVYAGTDGAGLLAQARELGVADAVIDLGEQTSAEALALLDGALAGVVVVSPDFQYAYPGKVFEILGRARPLLVLAPQGCDTAELTIRHALGWTHPPEDVEGLADSLRHALAGELPVPRDLEVLSAPRVMARLTDLLEDLVRR
jgi:glycosyltransferase involved in cell wall biosynthesis